VRQRQGAGISQLSVISDVQDRLQVVIHTTARLIGCCGLHVLSSLSNVQRGTAMPDPTKDEIKATRQGLLDNCNRVVHEAAAICDTALHAIEERDAALDRASKAEWAIDEVARLRERVEELDARVGHLVIIGPLLDIWDGIPNDVKSDDELASLRREIDRLSDIVEGDIDDQR